MTAPVRAESRRTIPFDYAFRFGLTGSPGKVHNETVRVSVEAPFVAVAVGYGVVPRRDPLRFGPGRAEDLGLTTLPKPDVRGAGRTLVPIPPSTGPGVAAVPAAPLPAGPVLGFTWPPTLSDIRVSWIANALRRSIRENAVSTQSSGDRSPERQRAADSLEMLQRGFRLNPELTATFLARGHDVPISIDELLVLFEEIPPDTAQIQFLYQLFDEGTGRSFQSDPILSTAGLGIQDGDRPFRTFAVPIEFGPLAAIRMEVTEKSDVPCELHVSLHGFRILGGRGSPTDVRRRR